MTTTHRSPARRTVAVLGALVLTLTGLSPAVAAPSAPTGPADAAAVAAAPANVALLGTPSASYTASWNRVTSVNDSVGVSTGGSGEATWATWGQDPRPASQWLEYTWDAPVQVDRSVLRFWSDGADANGDNVRVPASWSIQYWDDADEAFVDLPAPSGFPTDRLGLNETTFEPVSTTRLRATFQALAGGDDEYSAVGVSEWEVWGTGGVVEPEPEDPFGPIDHTPVHIPTQVGVVPELPGQLDAVYEDGRVVRVAVTWAEVTADDVAEPGTFEVTGTSPDLVEPVDGTVYVREGAPGPVVALDNVAVVTLAGTEPVLPPAVTAEYEDGSRDSRTPVVWADVEPAEYAEAGDMFLVAGEAEGTDVPAEAVVFVLEPDTAEDTSPPSVTLTAAPVAAPSGWYVQPVTVTVLASDNRDPDPRVEVTVDGGEPAPYTGPFTLEGDGTHTVRVVATDAAGNVGEAERELRVDTTAPVTTSSVENLGSSVEITLEATDGDGSGVDRIQWEGPGTFWGTYTGPFTRALTDSEQVIEFAATDTAGNAEERGSLTLPAAEAELPISAEASARCVAGTVHVAVRAANGSDVPVDMVLTTEHGSQDVAGVEPGASAYQSFATRAAAVPEGTASVTATGTVDGQEVTVRHDIELAALSCA